MKASDVTDKLKRYPVAVVCVVLLSIFGAMLFLRSGVTAELSANEADLNSRIRTIEQNIKNANNIRQDAEDLKVIVDKIKSLLFDANERAINISFFYEFEDLANVVISNINQAPQPDPVYAEGGARKLNLHSTLVFNVTLSGSFKNTLRFLHELDRVDPLMRVADFQISRSAPETGGDNVDARLRVLVLAKKN